mgnify:CR=1 FL=1
MEKRVGLRTAVRMALAGVTGIGVCTAGIAVAQDEVAVQEKVTVTGSRIKRVDVDELYDANEYVPKVRHVLGKPMFLY